MNCEHASRLWDAYLDGELSPQLRLEVDAHRIRCRRCQQSLALLEAVGHVIAQPPADQLSDDFTEALLRRRRGPTVAKGWGRRVVRVVLPAVSAAAAVLALALLYPETAERARDTSVVAQTSPSPDPPTASDAHLETDLVVPVVTHVKGALARVSMIGQSVLKATESKLVEGLAPPEAHTDATPMSLFWELVGPPQGAAGLEAI